MSNGFPEPGTPGSGKTWQALMSAQSRDLENLKIFASTESKTGFKWLAGQDVFRKVVSIGRLPNATSKTFAHNLGSFRHIVRMYGVAEETSSGTTIPLPCVSTISGGNQVHLSVSGANINIEAAADYSTYDGYVVLEYTKV